MPKYKKKVTSLMGYDEFKEAIDELPITRQAFLTVLFFAGCRVSEALDLTPDDIRCKGDMIYIQFFRLKGSKQTDPQEIPWTPALEVLCQRSRERGLLPIFNFCRSTAYRIVKSVFPQLYPHYFRMNRIVKTSEMFGDPTVYNVFGICAQSIDHYRGKVDVKRVGKALREEIQGVTPE